MKTYLFNSKSIVRRYSPLAVAAFMMFSCQNESEIIVEQTIEHATIDRSDLDNHIWQTVKKEGSFDWHTQSEQIIWNALSKSDGVLSVGFKPKSQNKDIRTIIDKIDIATGEWNDAKNYVLDMIFESERKLNPDLKREELIAFQENTLPVLDVVIKNPTTLALLRNSEFVRYAEPMGYEPNISKGQQLNKELSSSGCGGSNPENGLVNGVDYTTFSPNSKASWNHPFHNVSQAWNTASGSGITAMIIDTGSSFAQNNYGSGLNQGLSQGRTIEKLVTLPRDTFWGIPIGSAETPDDGCGHGTAMTGVLGGSRGTDGSAAGIAYNANLVTVRAAEDVLIEGSRESKGVSDAYVIAGNRSDIRVTSMSLGRITNSSQIADAVRYAYNRNVLIFCAAGTSFGWSSGWFGVIFPATMSETVAVTGVKDNMQRCDACHDGSAVDFVVVMEKASNGRHPLTLAMSGDVPATVGGSSVATAQTAGMAALVWSANKSLTRNQVLNKLKVSASYYPNRNSNFGWGKINLQNALTASAN
ncbi:S8/S53 family peptidase [Bernardetia sp. MNP-M8]|uniref:S8 family peptidase n=1 Tax=Bernardetia sp. MNP-M8 TaxID=3127470 RepID=UPI0030CA873A